MTNKKKVAESYRRLQQLSWKQAADLDRDKTVVIVPTGSLEQHGKHLPLGTDSIVTEAVVEMVIERLGDRLDYIVLPLIPIGTSPEHMDFPGTVTFSAETYLGMIKDLCASLASHGFRNIVFLNGHGGNTAMIQAATFQARRDPDLHVFFINIWPLVRLMGEDMLKREAHKKTDLHAGELETSCMLAIDPNLVDMEQTVDEMCPKFDRGRLITFTGPVTMNWNSMHDVSSSGVSGQPSFASAEKGEAILTYLVDVVCRTVKEIIENW